MSEDPTPDPEASGGWTLLILPEDGGAGRTLRIPRSRLRWLKAGAWVLGTVILALAASWVYLAVRSSRVAALEDRVTELTAREAQVEDLARTLEEVEQAYENLRSLFGSDAAARAGELWLPPTRGGSPSADITTSADGGAPTTWPLTEPGFLTRALLEGAGDSHPGIDIAVPAGSYVRAAAGGVVVERGSDPVYGNVLVLEHAEGYRSRYAHNSLLLADSGAVVRRGEVIALSGSSGRSTAPHLHFEILQEELPVDPLTLVSQP